MSLHDTARKLVISQTAPATSNKIDLGRQFSPLRQPEKGPNMARGVVTYYKEEEKEKEQGEIWQPQQQQGKEKRNFLARSES